MLHAAFTKRAATNFPAAHAPGENHLHRIWPPLVMPIQTSRQPKLFAGTAEEPHRRLGQKLFTGTVYQSQLLSKVESKNGHVDFRHHSAQQRGCFQGSESLPAKRRTQIIYLEHHFTQSISTGGTPSAN